MPHIDVEWHSRELRFCTVFTAHLMLLFNRLVSLLLGFLMLGFCADPDSFKHETLHFKHVEGVIFLYGYFFLANIVKELLKEWIIGML